MLNEERKGKAGAVNVKGKNGKDIKKMYKKTPAEETAGEQLKTEASICCFTETKVALN